MKRILYLTFIILTIIFSSIAVAGESVTLYTKDGRSKIVDASTIDEWSKSGWYEKVTLYSKDGRSISILTCDVDAYKKVGWYDKVNLYSADGRTISVLTCDVDAYKTVGWYEGVTMFAPDGRSKTVPSFNVLVEESVGWKKGVTVYNKEGKSKLVSPFNLDAEATNGWYCLTLLYAPDGRIIEVTDDKVEAHIKVGWSKTPCDAFTYEKNFPKHQSIDKSVYYYCNNNTAYIKRGLTTLDNGTFDDTTLERIEIPDTVTKIDYLSFEITNKWNNTSPIKRMGIPKSVTDFSASTFSFSDNVKPKDLVIYCEKESEAEMFAKRYDINYVNATIIYSIDGNRTMMVTDEEKGAYIKSGLWYSSPNILVYTKDGNKKLIKDSELPQYKANGWTENKDEAIVTVFAYDGRTMDIGINQLEAYKNVGWYESLDEVRTLMVSLDYRYQYVFNDVVEANKAVGWYTVDDGLERMINNGGFFSVLKLVKDMEDSIPDQEFCRLRDKVCNHFVEKREGCPITVWSPHVSINSRGIPVATFDVENLTSEKVTGFTVEFICYDKNGNQTKDYGSAKVTATASNQNLFGYSTTTCSVELHGNTRTVEISVPKVTKVFRSYMSPWYK